VTARDRLLRDVLAYAREHGLADVSLRTLAAAIGTSHRMLIYHFGSKEGLLAAVVAAVEADQRAVLVGMARGSGDDPATAMRRFWADLADPGKHEAERLFFETVAMALRGQPGTEGLRAGLVQPWLDAAEELPADTVRLDARVGMALVRGLLLDLLATGDRDGVDAAIDHFIARWLPASAPPRPGTPRSVT
jgi:AcrR family transcriptional regulator